MLTENDDKIEILDKIRDAERRFSNDNEKTLSINQNTVKIYDDHEKLIYFLAEGKADQINIIKRMTVKERIKFQQLKIEEIEKRRGNTSSEREGIEH